MRLLPESLGGFQRLDVAFLPPGEFVPGLVQLAVMPPAERHGELVADLETNGSRLGKAQVMRV